MLKKDWIKNIGLAIDRKDDNCPYEGIECECPNGTYLCSKCIEILMNNHDKEVRSKVIDDVVNLINSDDFKFEVNRSRDSLQEILKREIKKLL